MENNINRIGHKWRDYRNPLFLAVCIFNGWCVLMVQVGVSWSYAVFISLFSALVGYFVFLFIEVPVGDTLKDILDAEYQLGKYFNINLIIFLGLFLTFGISIGLNLLFLKDYKLGPKISSNLLVLFLTCIVLFALSGVSIITTYSSEYSQLDLFSQIKASLNYYSFYSIYILPNPAWFWIIALIIYHVILVVFIKFLYVKKNN